MDKYLFIARQPNGLAVHSVETCPSGNFLSFAHTLIDVLRNQHPDLYVEYCEIWFRTDHHAMTLLATAY